MPLQDEGLQAVVLADAWDTGAFHSLGLDCAAVREALNGTRGAMLFISPAAAAAAGTRRRR